VIPINTGLTINEIILDIVSNPGGVNESFVKVRNNHRDKYNKPYNLANIKHTKFVNLYNLPNYLICGRDLN
jgi:hypothetical protein